MLHLVSKLAHSPPAFLFSIHIPKSLLPSILVAQTCGGTRSLASPASKPYKKRRGSHLLTPDEALEKGLHQYTAKDYTGGVVTLTNALQAQKTVAGCLVNAAACCSALGNHLSALDFAFSGLTVNPGNDAAWYRGVCSLKGAGKGAEAAALLRLAPDTVKRRLRALHNIEHVVAASNAFLTFQTRKPMLLSPPTGEALQELRNAGCQYWGEKQFEKSLNAYKTIIATVSDDAAKILVLRASCYLGLKELSLAATDLSAAAVMDSGIKKEFRDEIFKGRVSVLRDLKLVEAANRLLEFVEPASACNPRDEGKPEEESDEDEEDFEADVSGWCEETLANVRKVDEQIGMKMKSRVPRFHEEYCEEPQIPNVDQLRTARRLKRIYTECVVDDNRLDAWQLLGKDHYAPTYNCKQRLLTASEWGPSSRIGDVLPREARYAYDTNCRMGYSNVYPQVMDLEYGCTHVAVGYVDLSVMLAANIYGDPAAGPVHVTGYDISPYAMAKSLVLLNMLQRGDPIDSVLQVGYSSGWSHATVEAFELSVRDLMTWGPLPQDVVCMLEHWSQGREVDLGHAQEDWLSYHGLVDALPANVKNLKDRMEVVEYFMTGRLLHCEVGSNVMYDGPENLPHMIGNETIFWTMSLKDLGHHYEECGSLMGVVTHVLRSRLERLQRRLLAGDITWELRLEEVNPETLEIHEEISNLNPKSISWSNLCDFVGNAEFHRMAEACSAPIGTQHYLHTIHWLKDVKGTHFVDYPESDRLELLKRCHERAAEEVRRYGLEKFLMAPPVLNPSIIAGMLPPEFFDKWCEIWFGAGGVKEDQVCEKVVHPFSSVGRWEGTGYLNYTYG